jgi:hypothetical protein
VLCDDGMPGSQGALRPIDMLWLRRGLAALAAVSGGN